MRQIDIAKFKQDWRRLAAKTGVDPTEGATSFQVASYNAHLRKRRTKRAEDRGWWKDPAKWDEWQTTERVDRSQTEDIVFRRMVECTRIRQRDYIGEMIADILHEIYRENESLQSIRLRTGGNQVWRTEVHRGREMWVRYADPIPRVVPVA